MDAAAWLSGLLALVGVGIGGLLSAWAQGRAWKREQMRQWEDARRGAYGRLVAAVREARLYKHRIGADGEPARRHPDLPPIGRNPRHPPQPLTPMSAGCQGVQVPTGRPTMVL
ncbi:hypothetical protein GCM10022225_71550 [Plantactinospora mayteni]|uniref:Uncharacterized protein n=1 Tax=Plantactinospora mayteni TaxID=566021 RepID=A0ABQ4F107_9ACTN|nr:hypothetical protein [Plantactinospora mayteni]GIH00608.1 hypothetical protein Pma05_71800 [Plantactinospora mayteni]